MLSDTETSKLYERKQDQGSRTGSMRMMSRLALAHMELFVLLVMATITPALVHAQGGPMSASASFQLSSDGYTMAAVKAGSGPAVIIVYGLGGRKEDFWGRDR